MNKKGFTLVELVGVIAILSIIVLITTITVNNVISNSRKSLLASQKSSLVKAAQIYYTEEGMKINEDYGCITVAELVEKGYITKDKVMNPETEKELTGSVKIEYNSKKYTYTYQDSICSICTLVSGEANTIGSKYECEVKPGTKHNFFVLSYNDANGAMIETKVDAVTTNLIMERNICSDGSPATSINPCRVTWHASAVDNLSGPVTAMDYIYIATSNWSNIPNIVMDYADEGNNYGGIKTEGNITKITTVDNTVTATYTTLKARMPYKSEVHGTNKCLTYQENGNKYGSCPLWLANYLKSSSYVTGEGLQNIEGINGYWTLSSAGEFPNAWVVSSLGDLSFFNIDDSIYVYRRGVRPVITLKL